MGDLDIAFGKDASYAESISQIHLKLANLGIEVEEVSWLNPVPNVWSVHIRSSDCKTVFTNGKGATKDAALASALGEFLERLGCDYFFADFYLDQTNSNFIHYPIEKHLTLDELSTKLPKKVWDFYNSVSLTKSSLTDFQSNKDTICALPFVNQNDNKTYYFPMQLLNNIYASNGMASGNSSFEAKTQAISECFERYVKNYIIANGITLPKIPDEYIQKVLPDATLAIKALQDKGFVIECLDASLGGVYPVVAIALFNPDNFGCFVSFGSHPNFKVAFMRTLTELLQGRSLNQLDNFPPPSFELDEIADPQNIEAHFVDSTGVVSWDMFKENPLHPFTEWNFDGTTTDEFNHLKSLLNTLDKEIYIAEYTHLNHAVCRVIIPDFSEIYPIDDLIWNNSNRGTQLRAIINNWIQDPGNKETCTQIIKLIFDLELDLLELIPSILGINVDKSSPWSQLRVGELLTYLYLAIDDLPEAAIYCQWTIDLHIDINNERLSFFRVLNNLLELKIQDLNLNEYSSIFSTVFNTKIYNLALQHITQNAFGYDLLHIKNIWDFKNHKDLQQFYQKLHAHKESFFN